MNKYKKIVFFAFLTIFVSFVIFSKKLGDMDEIWNYNFANCISKGLIPYRDFNIVQMPLLPIVLGIILKTTINSLIIIRIVSVLLWISVFITIYKILKKFKFSDSLIYCCIFIISIILKDYYTIDYNIFSVFLVLLILLFELSSKKELKINDFIVGILAGLVVLTKQTIGLTVCIGMIFYRLITLFGTTNWKDLFLRIIIRIIGISIPIALFIVYLLYNNSILYFWDYAVLGLKTFSNKISYISLFSNNSIIIVELSILIPLFWIFFFIYYFKGKDKNYLLLLIFSLSTFILSFPISDSIHFLYGSIVSLIGIMYFINNLFCNRFKSNVKIKKLFIIFYCVFIIMYLYYSVFCFMNINYLSTLNHFKYIPIDKNMEKNIIKLDSYILGSNKKVYILNFDAALYMIPIDKYNKDYDMFLKGNLGIHGEDGQIDKIKKSNALFLITKENIKRNWQNPEKVRKYVLFNLKKVDDIGFFEVYSLM